MGVLKQNDDPLHRNASERCQTKGQEIVVRGVAETPREGGITWPQRKKERGRGLKLGKRGTLQKSTREKHKDFVLRYRGPAFPGEKLRSRERSPLTFERNVCPMESTRELSVGRRTAKKKKEKG